MALDPMTFNNVSQAQFDKMQDEVRQEMGVEIAGDKGSASAHGFTITWDYNPESQDLTLQCTEKPWAIPATVVQNKLHELVEDNTKAE